MGNPTPFVYNPIASAFPYIRDLGVFKGQVGEKDEIRHMEQSNGFTVSCYLISAESTFDNAYAIECRGLVFNKLGHLVARPLHKFFNLNERVGARVEDINWDSVVRVMDKRDGSMIHTVKVGAYNGAFPISTQPFGDHPSSFVLKSKKSFQSEVAVNASAWMKTQPRFIQFSEHMTAQGRTAIFEWTSPTARIVLPYSQDQLTLLHVRDNDTGRYFLPHELKTVSETYGIPLVAEVIDFWGVFDAFTQGGDTLQKYFDLKGMQDAALTREGVEGWVVQFADGNMVKVKTKWYLERHRAMTFLRERDIVLMVLRESIDDLKAMLVGEGVNVAELQLLEEQTLANILEMDKQLRAIFADAKLLDKKSAALKYGPKGENFVHFGLLMNMMDGKEPDIKGWYERHVLPTISLRQLNLLQSVAEAE